MLLDFSAAFDTINHSILFDRMKDEIGLTGTALDWVTSYFSGRTTSVNINGAHSRKCLLNCGLLQGSIMGPLSFTIHTIPIGRIIRKCGLMYHLYADNVQLLANFDPSDELSIQSALTSLTLCIHDISLWMTSNSLRLNSDKTEFFVAISQHNKLCMPPVSLTIGNEVIQPSEAVRNLGVIFDTHMTMSSQVSFLCRSVSYHLRNISRIRHFLDYNTCNDIVRSLVLSRLDYGNVLLMGANAKQIARLQVLQN